LPKGSTHELGWYRHGFEFNFFLFWDKTTGYAKPVPYDVAAHSKMPIDDTTRERRDAVRNAMAHAWKGYRTHAWGRDELKPVSVIYLFIFFLIFFCFCFIVLFFSPFLVPSSLVSIISRILFSFFCFLHV
jgi:sensor histidine kinase YesM